MMMPITVSCRLGDQFEHTKTWGHKSPVYFVGLDFFAWHCCGFEGFTIHGSGFKYNDCRAGFFGLRDLVDPPISFEVPYAMIRNDTGRPMREFGVDLDGPGWLCGLYLKQDGDWFYRLAKRDNYHALEVRTEELDKLFAPVLPAVKMSAADFL